jgi:hypothetical protein
LGRNQWAGSDRLLPGAAESFNQLLDQLLLLFQLGNIPKQVSDREGTVVIKRDGQNTHIEPIAFRRFGLGNEVITGNRAAGEGPGRDGVELA